MPSRSYARVRGLLAAAVAPSAAGIFDFSTWTIQWERALLLAARAAATGVYEGGAEGPYQDSLERVQGAFHLVVSVGVAGDA